MAAIDNEIAMAHSLNVKRDESTGANAPIEGAQVDFVLIDNDQGQSDDPHSIPVSWLNRWSESLSQSSSSILSFSTSVIVHVALMIFLALTVWSGAGGSGSDLIVVSSADAGESADSELFAMDMGAAGLTPSLDEASIAPMPTVTSDAEVTIAATAMPTMDIVSERGLESGKGLTSLIANAVGAGSGQSKGKGKGSGLTGTGASYFGVETKGEKFVFVVDSSRSMVGKRWTFAIRELIKSLDSLGPYQQFYVICFDFDARPVFDTTPGKEAYLKPDSQTIGRVQHWMKSLVNGFETRPANALQMAIAMQPDAIYLLSDGEIRDNSAIMLQLLNIDPQSGKAKIPIHTISLFSTEGKQTLKKIAETNGGKFTSVD